MESSLLYGLATLGAGVLALVIRYGFKSKCSEVSLCYGMVHIQRDIDQEIHEEKQENGMSGGIQRQSSMQLGNNL